MLRKFDKVICKYYVKNFNIHIFLSLFRFKFRNNLEIKYGDLTKNLMFLKWTYIYLYYKNNFCLIYLV